MTTTEPKTTKEEIQKYIERQKLQEKMVSEMPREDRLVWLRMQNNDRI